MASAGGSGKLSTTPSGKATTARKSGMESASSTLSSSSARKKGTNISSANVVLYPEAPADGTTSTTSPTLTRMNSPMTYQSPSHLHRIGLDLSNTLKKESAPPPKPRESLLPYKQKMPSFKTLPKPNPGTPSPGKSTTSKSSPSKPSPSKTTTKPTGSPTTAAGKDASTKLNMNKSQLKTFEHIRFNDYPKLESFYGLPPLPFLKILDISNNGLDSIELLPSLPLLKELYLSSNLLTDLSNLPSFPQLEVLSLSFNSLTDLVGLKEQPELKAFFVSCNNIKTLAGFPLLPKLESLKIEGNPLMEQQAGKICTLVVAGDSLEKLNGQAITQAERDETHKYPVILASAIREGYIFGEHTFNISAVCHQYLIERQKLNIEEMGSQEDIVITGSNIEGDVITVEFVLGCTDHIHRDDLNMNLTTGLLTGTMRYQWYRGEQGGFYVVIPDATKKSYKISSVDVGHGLKCECSLIMPDGSVGPVFYAICDNALPTPPSALSVAIVGTLVEGSQVLVKAVYGGGIEGESTFEWFRVSKSDEITKMEEQSTQACEYTLTPDDVGYRLQVVYTPVRYDGAVGTPVSVTSEPISAVLPRVWDIFISGTLAEGELLSTQYKISGGSEANNELKWFRGIASSEGILWEQIPDATSTSYTLALEDIGKVVKFQFLPVNDRGIPGGVGEEVTKIIQPAPPVFDKLSIAGKLEEGFPLTLTGKYSGGFEGASIIRWFRKDQWSDDSLEIEGATQKTYAPTLEDVGCYLIAHYTPVRNDGLTGKKCIASSIQAIKAGLPRVVMQGINGEPAVGAELISKFKYQGGEEGDSLFYWVRKKGDVEEQIKGTEGKRVYFATEADVGHRIGFRHTPAREDGEVGESTAIYTTTIGETGNIPQGDEPTEPATAQEQQETEKKESEVSSEAAPSQSTRLAQDELEPVESTTIESAQERAVAASPRPAEESVPTESAPVESIPVPEIPTMETATVAFDEVASSDAEKSVPAEFPTSISSAESPRFIQESSKSVESATPISIETESPREVVTSSVDAVDEEVPRSVLPQPIAESPRPIESAEPEKHHPVAESPRSVGSTSSTPREVASTPISSAESPRSSVEVLLSATTTPRSVTAESPRPTEDATHSAASSPRPAVTESPRPAEEHHHTPRSVAESPRSIAEISHSATTTPEPHSTTTTRLVGVESPRLVEGTHSTASTPRSESSRNVEDATISYSNPPSVQESPRPVGTHSATATPWSVVESPRPAEVSAPHSAASTPRAVDETHSAASTPLNAAEVHSSTSTPRSIAESPRPADASALNSAVSTPRVVVESPRSASTTPRDDPQSATSTPRDVVESHTEEAHSEAPSPHPAAESHYHSAASSPRAAESSSAASTPREAVSATSTPRSVQESPRPVETHPTSTTPRAAELAHSTSTPLSVPESPRPVDTSAPSSAAESPRLVEQPYHSAATRRPTSAESPLDVEASHSAAITPRQAAESPSNEASSTPRSVQKPHNIEELSHSASTPRSVKESPRPEEALPTSAPHSAASTPRSVAESPRAVENAPSASTTPRSAVAESPRGAVENSNATPRSAVSTPRSVGESPHKVEESPRSVQETPQGSSQPVTPRNETPSSATTPRAVESSTPRDEQSSTESPPIESSVGSTPSESPASSTFNTSSEPQPTSQLHIPTELLHNTSTQQTPSLSAESSPREPHSARSSYSLSSVSTPSAPSSPELQRVKSNVSRDFQSDGSSSFKDEESEVSIESIISGLPANFTHIFIDDIIADDSTSLSVDSDDALINTSNDGLEVADLKDEDDLDLEDDDLDEEETY